MTAAKKAAKKPRKVVVWAVVLTNQRGARVVLQAYPYFDEAEHHRKSAKSPNVRVVRCVGEVKA